MKTDISFLPENKQRDLNKLVQWILERLPETEMIILFGSYARNEYVEYDQHIEFGTPTFYMSDYDLLVVTHNITEEDADRLLDQVEFKFDRFPRTPVQFIQDDITHLNKQLSEGRYFYAQIKEEGIELYNKGNFTLNEPRKLNYSEIKQQAQEYFYEKFESANEFLFLANVANKESMCKKASFLLHQVVENCFQAISLTYTLYKGKNHNLRKLIKLIKADAPDVLKVFPCNTPEEEHLFDLIKKAYIEGRYNPDFKPTKEEIEALIAKVKNLIEITEEVCKKKLAEYEELA